MLIIIDQGKYDIIWIKLIHYEWFQKYLLEKAMIMKHLMD